MFLFIFVRYFSTNEKALSGVPPHRDQAKKSKYPKTRKLASPGENVQFFVLGAL
ncbi:hypothetical protein bmyco0003_51610 [Bacillus pseudomycoides]|nr:hypothetical protein bmyco0003_51610 [Bacillus pseudomycoides]